MKKTLLWICVILMALVWMGCAAAPSRDEAQFRASPNEMIEELERDFQSAEADGVASLAPDQFRKARAALVKARQAMDKDSKSTVIQGHAAESRNYLQQALEVARMARSILSDTSAAREKAIAAGALELGAPFQMVENRYLRLTAAIEANDIRYAQDNAAAVQQEFHAVEIMAIKHAALDPIRRIMDQAARQETERIVPQAYAQAAQALREADEYIQGNPYDPPGIKEKSTHALFMAQRMTSLAKNSMRLEGMLPETAALLIETQITALSNALNTADLRNLELTDQVSALSTTAQNLISNNRSLEKLNQSYQTQIDAMQQRIAGLQGFSREQEAAKERLAAEREFNERFDQVQNYFSANEAEVYKQGNQLVIRMRGIQFPVGQSTLSAENYGLLSKVQRAIRTFDNSSIVIEGHTDSTGSSELNQRLSQERAQAVQAYLVANDASLAGRIKSAGYGSGRPLAANDTAEGRAVNRRIDVRITPAPTR